MWADTEEELHEMADKIGLKREWFQPYPEHSIPHYDLVPSRRLRAIKLGAVARELTLEDFRKYRPNFLASQDS